MIGWLVDDSNLPFYAEIYQVSNPCPKGILIGQGNFVGFC